MRTTIQMAREAAGDDWGLFQEYMPEIHRLAELVRADEREACAKECERMMMYPNARQESAAHQDVWAAAKAIRARGNT